MWRRWLCSYSGRQNTTRGSLATPWDSLRGSGSSQSGWWAPWLRTPSCGHGFCAPQGVDAVDPWAALPASHPVGRADPQRSWRPLQLRLEGSPCLPRLAAAVVYDYLSLAAAGGAPSICGLGQRQFPSRQAAAGCGPFPPWSEARAQRRCSTPPSPREAAPAGVAYPRPPERPQ